MRDEETGRQAEAGIGVAGDGRVHPFEPPFGSLGAGPEELESAGLIGAAVPPGMFLEPIGLMGGLKARRESMGLILAPVSERSGLPRQAIGRLGLQPDAVSLRAGARRRCDFGDRGSRAGGRGRDA